MIKTEILISWAIYWQLKSRIVLYGNIAWPSCVYFRYTLEFNISNLLYRIQKNDKMKEKKHVKNKSHTT